MHLHSDKTEVELGHGRVLPARLPARPTQRASGPLQGVTGRRC